MIEKSVPIPRKPLAVGAFVLAIALALPGCTIKLISSYDETTDKTVTALQKKTEAYGEEISAPGKELLLDEVLGASWSKRHRRALFAFGARLAQPPHRTIDALHMRHVKHSLPNTWQYVFGIIQSRSLILLRFFPSAQPRL